MYVAGRLREIREAKNLSQGDIEHKTGLLRCYISRVENGHTVPAIETLEKLARAYDLKLYQLFYEGNETPPTVAENKEHRDWASNGKGERMFAKFSRLAPRLSELDRTLILHMAGKFGLKKRSRGQST